MTTRGPRPRRPRPTTERPSRRARARPPRPPHLTRRRRPSRPPRRRQLRLRRQLPDRGSHRVPVVLHVFLGTKAQYIKTAPVIHELERRAVAYRLIDSGQHAQLTRGLRAELGIREPDVALGGSRDVESIPQAISWSAGVATKLASRGRLQREVFGGESGTCVLHGDTPTTLLSAAM